MFRALTSPWEEHHVYVHEEVHSCPLVTSIGSLGEKALYDDHLSLVLHRRTTVV
jgi:hypothetical protein